MKLQCMCALILGILLGGPAAAEPTFKFECITNNNATDAEIGEAQLSVELRNLGSQVEFLFKNIGTQSCSITAIYFDDSSDAGVLNLPLEIQYYGGQVEFIPDDTPIIKNNNTDYHQVTPAELPGGNEMNPPFVVTAFLNAELSADAVSPPSQNGINEGEQMGIRLTGSYDSVLANIMSQDLRIGIKVQGFESKGSEGFVNTITVVPAPGAAMLALTGLGCVAAGKRKR